MRWFLRSKGPFELKTGLFFLQKGAWRRLVAFWSGGPPPGPSEDLRIAGFSGSVAQKWPIFTDFVVCRLVLTSLKAKRARVWAPGVHQRAFWTNPGSETPFWARAEAPKSRRTACPGEIACHGGAEIAVWGHITAAGGRVATESGCGRPFPG